MIFLVKIGIFRVTDFHITRGLYFSISRWEGVLSFTCLTDLFFIGCSTQIFRCERVVGVCIKKRLQIIWNSEWRPAGKFQKKFLWRVHRVAQLYKWFILFSAPLSVFLILSHWLGLEIDLGPSQTWTMKLFCENI